MFNQQNEDILMMSIDNVSSLIKNKKISPVELVEEALNRINTQNDNLNAFITVLADKSLEDAKIAEREIMENGFLKSNLHGIPIALKDLFYTKGILTTAGSKLLSNFKPKYDSTVITRLYNAGAILMGKTNLHGWALGPTGDSYYGPTRNPWDLSRSAGGSSGGSAAAVASGMVYMGMGTDTGGSIRIPSSLCGVVGFKPTYGLVSLYGVIPVSFTLDHAGPITRSVMDVAITIDLITGYDAKDPCKNRYMGKSTNFSEKLKCIDNLKGVTIGIPINYYFDKVDYEIEKLFQESISEFKQLGAIIKYVNISHLDIVLDFSTIILFSEAAFIHENNISLHPDEYKPKDVRECLKQGLKYTAIDYIKALQKRDEIINAWNKALSYVDVVITPTLPITAFKIGSKSVFTRGREESVREMCVRHTRLANMTGCPALTIPCGFTSAKLPVGIMIMGRNNDDITVLKVGYAYEKHHPYNFKQF